MPERLEQRSCRLKETDTRFLISWLLDKPGRDDQSFATRARPPDRLRQRCLERHVLPESLCHRLHS